MTGNKGWGKGRELQEEVEEDRQRGVTSLCHHPSFPHEPDAPLGVFMVAEVYFACMCVFLYGQAHSITAFLCPDWDYIMQSCRGKGGQNKQKTKEEKLNRSIKIKVSTE